MAHRPIGVGVSFDFSAGSSTLSTSFSVQSNVLRVVATGGAAHVAIGTNPTAAVTDYFIPSGGTATLALTKASNRVVGVTTGTTTTITFAEGTESPFGIGDYVSFSASGQPYYDFDHYSVSSVNTTASVGGYYSTQITIAYDSSGIVTAFSSPDATLRSSQRVAAYGVGNGTLYAQQIQISGDA